MKRRDALQVAVLLLASACECPPPSDAGAQTPPVLDDVAARGRDTAERLQHHALSYRVSYATKPGTEIGIHTTLAPTWRRWEVGATVRGEPVRFGTVVERAGFWELDDLETGRRRYRPWEAHASLTSFYTWLARAEVTPLTAASALDGYSHVETRGEMAMFRGRAEEQWVPSFWQTLDEVDALVLQGRFLASWRMAEDMHEVRRGAVRFVHLPTGLALHGHARLWPTIRDIAWDRAPEKPTNLPPPSDEAGSWSSPDVVMVHANPGWTPSTRHNDGDLRLLNLQTGEVRRPAIRGQALPGCFGLDRRKIYVPAQLVERGGLFTLVENDLVTGESRAVASSLPPSTFLAPVLSPDGRKLAVLYKPGRDERVRESQVAVIDLATDEATLLGPVADLAWPQWLPDGNGVLVTCRGGPARDDRICRITEDGVMTPLVHGDTPVVLDAQRGFIFDEDGEWKQANLDGSNVRKLGDGLRRHAFPSLSPDGTRLVLLRTAEAGEAPRLVVVELDTLAVRDVKVPPGLWTWPSWR
ncbi:MAG: hypothetical protein AB2A00_17760 [Myxococcota bacterium]